MKDRLKDWKVADKLRRLEASDSDKQPLLVSGTNIKTINGNSLLGSGDLSIGGAAVDDLTDEVFGQAITLAYDVNDVLETVTTALGTKTFAYNADGTVDEITGTGSYLSKSFTYDVDGNLTNVTII